MTAPDSRQDIGSWSTPAGDNITITLTLTAGGAPVNLTAYGTTWAAKLRTSYQQEPPVVFTVDYSNAATGVLKLALTGTQTAGMTVASGDSTTWQFDVQASGGAVSPQTPFKGTLKVWRVNTHA